MCAETVCIINSIPKSGTYFTGALLEQAGLRPTGYHLRNQHYWDWTRAGSLEDIIRDPFAFRSSIPLAETHTLIGAGYTYAHLNHTAEAIRYLTDIPALRHLFIVRDLRACLLSSMRFVEKRQQMQSPEMPNVPVSPGRFCEFLDATCKAFVDGAAKQIGWKDHPGVGLFRFEDLVEAPDPVHRAESCRRLLEFCGIAVADAQGIADRAIATPTRTSSGNLSDWRSVWGPAAQEKFSAAGGPALNAALGYADD